MDHNTKKQIISEASKAFSRYGIKGTTMQLLAESLHISKRTLYEYFPDKNALLTECTRQACTASLHTIRIRSASVDGLKALWCTADSAYKLLTKPNPAFRIEIARIHSIRTLLDENYRIPLQRHVEEQFLRARSQGLILPDIEPQPFSALLERLLIAAAGEISPVWNRRKGLDGILRLFLAGICSEQGRKQLIQRNPNH